MKATLTTLRVLRRFVSVALTSSAVVAAMVFFFAWLALRIPWEIPDRGAITGPSEIVDQSGVVLARFDSEVDRRLVSIENVAPVAQAAVVVSEDSRFYEHDGVDPPSLIRAIVTNVRTDGITQGGSTLTQQYVKNAFLTPERTITRKIREAVISIALERQMEKDEILEAYLNEVYFGEGAYGIEAAARTYFGVSAAELDPAESATLAQLLPGPSTRNPRKDPLGARQRRDDLLARMATLGRLSTAEAENWSRKPMLVLPRVSATRQEPYFVEYVRKQIINTYGEDALLTGRLTVETTIDLRQQAMLAAAVEAQLPRQPEPFQDVDAGAAVIDPATGDIKAIYSGRSFQDSELDLATQLVGRQPGSTFKPFVFLTALNQGMLPEETYRAPGSVIPDTCEPLEDGTNPFKKPVENAGGRGFGRMTIANALSNSVNTVFVQLGCDVGPQNIVNTMSLMGVRNAITPEPFVSIGSGSSGPSPLDMASAYATLANDGLACPARSILRVSGPDGELPLPIEITTGVGQDARPRTLTEDELMSRPPELREMDKGRCRQVLSPDIARTAIQAMERVVEETTATRAQIGRPQAGKTGTTDGPKDAWFVGFTPNLSMAVWVGDTNRDGEGGLLDLRGVNGFRTVFGGTIPALIWRDAATALLADQPIVDFLEPGELVVPDGVEGRQPGPVRGRPPNYRSPSPTPTPTETTESETETETVAPNPPGSRPSPTETPTSDEPAPEPTAETETETESDGGGCLIIIGDC